jgi:uncharacterized membrane protein YphA (DoxX/SURF4 family)
MNGLTRFFLVLLRLAIGWHFLFEGVEKVESIHNGPTETNRPFSSEGYLREATGPISGLMRKQIGDPDEAALKRLTVLPLSSDQDSSRTPARQRLSQALNNDWDLYFDIFCRHYELDGDTKDLARIKLDQAKELAGRWLLEGVKQVDRPLSASTVKIRQTTPQRIEEYNAARTKLQDALEKELPAFDRDVEKQNLRILKSDINRRRTELLADLKQILTDSLNSTLSEEQKKKGPIPPPSREHWWEMSKLEWIDGITSWGLVVVGLCLLVGFFTRTMCFAGALFLLMLYLTITPFPWLPQAPIAEGHYYFVNKNLIEMLALVALATTRSGYWLGVDGIARFLNPFRWRSGKSA